MSTGRSWALGAALLAQMVAAREAQAHPARFWPLMGGSLCLAGLVTLPEERRELGAPTPGWALAAVAVGAGLHLLVRAGALLLGGGPRLRDHLERVRAGAHSVPAPLAAALAVPAAAGEELYWRGLQPGPRFGGEVVGPALWYAGCQLPSGNPLLALGALPLGLAGGWLRMRSGSLIPAVIAHVVFSELTLVWPGLPAAPGAASSRVATET